MDPLWQMIWCYTHNFVILQSQHPLLNTSCLTFITTCKSYVTKSEALEGPHRSFTSLSENQEVLVDQKKKKKSYPLLILAWFARSLQLLLSRSVAKWLHDVFTGVWVKFGADPGVKWGLEWHGALEGRGGCVVGRWVGAGTAAWLRDHLAAQTGMFD